MIITTTETVKGYEIVRTIGLVRGNVVRTKHIGTDFIAAFRNLVGGEIPEYTSMIAGAREQALARMIEEAEGVGANGIICVRFTTSMIMHKAAELLTFGTAVELRPKG